MWKNIVEPDKPQITILFMRMVCWIPKATETHTEYVILTAFPLQQLLYERLSMLRYTYIGCLAFTETKVPYKTEIFPVDRMYNFKYHTLCGTQ